MKHLLNFIPKARPKATALTASPPFEVQFSICQTHGQFPLNAQDEEGVIRWTNGYCPTCQKNERTQRLFDQAGLGKKYEHCCFENFQATTPKQQQIKMLCEQYATNFDQAHKSGQSLVLCGKTGTGKNHLATAICQRLMQKNYTALLVKASYYLDAYWSKAFDERMSWLQAIALVDLFILDELGKTSQAKTAQDALFRLIDTRYENCRPTLLTTNLNRDGLLEVLGEAAFDRLSEGGGMRLTLNWGSFRSTQPVGGNQ